MEWTLVSLYMISLLLHHDREIQLSLRLKKHDITTTVLYNDRDNIYLRKSNLPRHYSCQEVVGGWGTCPYVSSAVFQVPATLVCYTRPRSQTMSFVSLVLQILLHCWARGQRSPQEDPNPHLFWNE